MMKHHVRVSSNFVNLGNLYGSFLPTKKRPSGWGYFEDGSIFIAPHGYLNHAAFEMRMKVTAHVVAAPTAKMQAMGQNDPYRKRFVVINKDNMNLARPILRLSARNACDGEHAAEAEHPFEHVTVAFDKNTHEYISTGVQESFVMSDEKRRVIKQALNSFRGTFVDGSLQPNVRLGNGLEIRGVPTVQKPRIVENLKSQEATVKAFAKSKKPTKESSKKSSPVKLSVKALELREAALKAKTRELRAKEETLRRRYRAWSLEQRMAMKASRLFARRRARPRAAYGSDFSEDLVEEPENRSTNKNTAKKEYQPENSGDVFALSVLENSKMTRTPDRLDNTGDLFPSSGQKPASNHTSTRRSQPSDGEAFPSDESPSPSQSQTSSTEYSPETNEDISPFTEFESTPPPALQHLRSRLLQPGRRTPTMRSSRGTRSS